MSQSDKNSQDELPETSLFPAKLDLSVEAQRRDGHDQSLPTIPNYEIDRCIGKGGFGAVFRAIRTSDLKAFAIKVLHVAGGVGNEMRQRFLREATILCQLDHPRIVAFRELGITGSDLFLVMDYVENTPWKELCQPLRLPKKIEIATGVVDHCLDALIYTHNKGIVHRDIKPNNILLENRGKKLHVRLADFGLAKSYLQAGHSGVTSEHEIGGTMSYLAPELLGGIKFFKPESDQYSLAATLYEMIAGRPPIIIRSGDNPLLAIRRHMVPRIDELVTDIPDGLAEWIHRGLQTDPSKRFQTTQQMRDMLQEVARNGSHTS